MDAGVDQTASRGVAMGLVMEGNRYAILSDIAGVEDHYGDMDSRSPDLAKVSPLCRWTSIGYINAMITGSS